MPVDATAPPGAKKDNTGMIVGIVVVLLLVIVSVVVAVVGYKKGWFTSIASTSTTTTAATPIDTATTPITPIAETNDPVVPATETTAADDKALDAGNTEESTAKETKVKDSKGDTYNATIVVNMAGNSAPATTDQKTRVDSKAPVKDSGSDVYFVANKAEKSLSGPKISWDGKNVSFGGVTSWGMAQQWKFQKPNGVMLNDEWKAGSYFQQSKAGKYLSCPKSDGAIVLEDYTGQAAQRWVWDAKANTLRNVINGTVYSDSNTPKCDPAGKKVISIVSVNLGKVNDTQAGLGETAGKGACFIIQGTNIFGVTDTKTGSTGWSDINQASWNVANCTWHTTTSKNSNGWFYSIDNNYLTASDDGKTFAVSKFSGLPAQVWNCTPDSKRMVSNSKATLINADTTNDQKAERGTFFIEATIAGVKKRLASSPFVGDILIWVEATDNTQKWTAVQKATGGGWMCRYTSSKDMYLTAPKDNNVHATVTKDGGEGDKSQAWTHAKDPGPLKSNSDRLLTSHDFGPGAGQMPATVDTNTPAVQFTLNFKTA